MKYNGNRNVFSLICDKINNNWVDIFKIKEKYSANLCQYPKGKEGQRSEAFF